MEPCGGPLDSGYHAVPGAHGGVAERLGEEALADADGADEQDVLAAVEEAQRAGGVEEAPVEPDGGRPVEVLEPAELLEAGLAQAQLQAPVSAGPAHARGVADEAAVAGVLEEAPREARVQRGCSASAPATAAGKWSMTR